jgi:hypothetical protein
MKPLCLLAAFMLVLISCSKPSGESSEPTDSTDAATASTSANENRVPATLTAAEAERVADELFVLMHKGLVSNGTVVLGEEYFVDGNTFRYTVILHNLDSWGLSGGQYSANGLPTQEQVDAYDADTSQDKSYPVGESYSQTNYYYISQIDTFYVDGEYSAYIDDPESTPRVLTVELGGKGLIHQNAAEVGEDGIPKFSPKTYWYINPMEGPTFLDTDVVTINLGEPFEFKTDDLYLKAKIKDLTDADLARLSKEQLGIVRNDIFAHHGHTFKTSKMVTHYQPMEWYHPIVDDAAPLLNKFEKRNVDFIKKKEG